jgi:hypothetical protein
MFSQLTGHRSSYTPVVTRTPSTQILVSNTVLQYNKSRILGMMADCREVYKITLDPLVVPKKQRGTKNKNPTMVGYVKRAQSQ